MKSVYLVKVDDAKRPVFADTCVVCGGQSHERLTAMTMCDEHGRMDFYLYKLSDKNAVGSLLEIPVHDACVKALRNDSLKRFAVIFAVALSILIIGLFSRFSIWPFIFAAAVVAVPFLYLEFTNPVPVEFYRQDRAYFMLFRDRGYAQEFARLNGAQVEETGYPYFGRAD